MLLAKLGMDNFCGCRNDNYPRRWMDSVIDKWEAKAAHRISGYYKAYLAWWWLSQRQFEEGKVEKAQKSFQRAVSLGGDEAQGDSKLWNEYAWNLTNVGKTADAIGAARRSVALTPEDAAHWDTLGRALLENNQPTEAVTALEKAVHYDRLSESRWYGKAGQLEIRYHLIDAYVSSGLPDRAEPIIEEMVSIDSGGAWIRRARTRLSQAGE
jgi:tetratricopeptide (TPR) repeat protein